MGTTRVFDAGTVFDVDNNSPDNGVKTAGTLHYSAPDGSVVVVDLALHEAPQIVMATFAAY